MSMRFTAKVRTGTVALAVVAGLALGATACGGGGDDDKKPQSSASSSKSTGTQPNPRRGSRRSRSPS